MGCRAEPQHRMPMGYIWEYPWVSKHLTRLWRSMHVMLKLMLCLQGHLQAAALLLLSVWTAICGLFCISAQDCSIHDAAQALRQLALLATGVYLMSPLLQTLTRSVSRCCVDLQAPSHAKCTVKLPTDRLTSSCPCTLLEAYSANFTCCYGDEMRAGHKPPCCRWDLSC